MSMTKAEHIQIVREKTLFTRQESEKFVEQVFEIIEETLEKVEKVKISGFGNFVVREKKQRKGKNPKTGEELIISGRRVLIFKPSAILRKVVNKGIQYPEASEIQE